MNGTTNRNGAVRWVDRFPREIITEIFLLDPTFHEYYYEKVLPYLRKSKLYLVSNKNTRRKDYLAVQSDYTVITDSLQAPNYRSTIYFSKKEYVQDYLNFFDIVEFIPHPPKGLISFPENQLMTWQDFIEEDYRFL
jgi:hypothetical protein